MVCQYKSPSSCGPFAGHAVALDLTRTELFCCACKDYVYDADFDRAATARSAWNPLCMVLLNWLHNKAASLQRETPFLY